MANISFWGGVGVIGSSKVLIEQDGWRIILDFGLEFNPGQGLFRGRAQLRSGHELEDRLRTGIAPWLPYVYRADALGGVDLAGGADGRTAVFISHCHLDHIGLTGFIDPMIPIYGSPDTVRMMDALEKVGENVDGGHPTIIPLEDGEAVNVGPMRVTRYPVDHDVIGASGYAIETENGLVAFTGDIRLHGRHPERSLAFADAVQGARGLVIEGTTLTAGFREPQWTEWEVDQQFQSILDRTPGLVMMTVYPRNLERILAFLHLAKEAHRVVLWPSAVASFLSHMGILGVKSFDASVIGNINAYPDRYVVQVAVTDLAWLLDLPTGPGAVFVHANGEPLGSFDPDWSVLQDWLAYTRTTFWSIGTSGHASPDDLHQLVERIRPDIVFPLHSLAPDRLVPPPGSRRWLPQRGGRRYPLQGR